MRTIQLVYSNPVPGMEDAFNQWHSDRRVFSGNFYETAGEKVVKR